MTFLKAGPENCISPPLFLSNTLASDRNWGPPGGANSEKCELDDLANDNGDVHFCVRSIGRRGKEMPLCHEVLQTDQRRSLGASGLATRVGLSGMSLAL